MVLKQRRRIALTGKSEEERQQIINGTTEESTADNENHNSDEDDVPVITKKQKLENGAANGTAAKKLNGGFTVQRSKPPPKPAASAAKNTSAAFIKLQEERKRLPIFSARDILLNEIEQNKILIVVGETGSGKTTQIPQYIAEYHQEKHNNKKKRMPKIAITQPRRVAALSISKRVSEEMGVKLGEEVGYSIRFEDTTSQKTYVKYMTDGMLLRECQVDPLLKQYSYIILDEAHERTLHTDVLFGLVKRVIRQREDLKLIIMSATLEAEAFSKFYDDAKIIYISGRTYPVDLFYTEENQHDFLDATVTTAIQLHLEQPYPGDILVFLTGQEEIESVEKILQERAKLLPPEVPKLLICPIFAALPQEKQMQVFDPAPAGCRKIILATNIAETSITINGIKLVMDTGFVKQRAYDPTTGLEVLKQTKISKASARQRMGRAGREAPGKCFRLFTEEEYDKFEEYTVPEILRANLSTIVLQMKSMGISDILNFDFMNKPSRGGLQKAMEQLVILGALDKKLNLTEIGKKMAGLPLEPMFAVALLKSTEENLICLDEMLTIISMLTVSESIFYSPQDKREEANKAKRKFTSKYGDHITLLKVYREYVKAKGDDHWCFSHFINKRTMKKVIDVRGQLEEYLKSMAIIGEETVESMTCGRDLFKICKCLTAGFFMNAAVKLPNQRRYKSIVSGMEVFIHPSSVLEDPLPEYVVYNTMVKTTKQYMRDICSIDNTWLMETAPEFFRSAIKNAASAPAPATPSSPKTKKKKDAKDMFVVQRSP